LAAVLARAGATPNAISVFGLLLAVGGAIALACRGLLEPSPTLAAGLLVAGALGNQLRLLCNLMDGMVAVEHGGGGTAIGEIYNELPDRISDASIAVGVGYAASALPGSVELGFVFGLLCLLCAHVRALGATAGAGPLFQGPCSKPVRGAILSLACLVAAALVTTGHDAQVLRGALAVLVLGTAFTCVRRTLILASRLRA
jgi:phosphatidylglycerophosphate synthase